MVKLNFLMAVCLLVTNTFSFGQDYSIASLTGDLIKNSNAVVRSEQIKVTVEAVDQLTITTRRVVTVLNKLGERHVEAVEFFDNSNIKVKNQQATIYNAAGKEIRKFKQKEFTERSAIGSNDLYNDNRVTYLDYTPREYPYTVVYESEIKNVSTVFLRPWKPITSYFISLEEATYHLQNISNIPVRISERNFEGYKVQKEETKDGVLYKIVNVAGLKPEYLSPDIETFTPKVLFALEEFSLVGVKGKATNWKDFGKWQYDNLLAGKDKIPASTISKLNDLTANAKSDREKAEIVYDYVQNKTRYISVQLGIGGWEPMLASDVDRLGYGDCKALTNYTKALLETQGITSHYAVVFAGDEIIDIDEDFASMQGNHVILNIPQEEEDIWLECTSQTAPFGYLGDFTDNRNVLLVKPEGGEIVKTRKYTTQDNVRETLVTVELEATGSFSATINRTSRGISYGDIYAISRQKREDQDLYYKKSWGHLSGTSIDGAEFTDDREKKEFHEKISIKGDRLVTKAGKNLLLSTNFLKIPVYEVTKVDSRTTKFEINRGKTYKDTFRFIIPEGYTIESLPEDEIVESKFGIYTVKITGNTLNKENHIEVIRECTIHDGIYEPEEYNLFREFMIRISGLNNQKAVLAIIN